MVLSGDLRNDNGFGCRHCLDWVRPGLEWDLVWDEQVWVYLKPLDEQILRDLRDILAQPVPAQRKEASEGGHPLLSVALSFRRQLLSDANLIIRAKRPPVVVSG